MKRRMTADEVGAAYLRSNDFDPEVISDEALAEIWANYAIAETIEARKVRFYVLNREPAEWDWHRKNIWGIETEDCGRARAWFVARMVEGYVVSWCWAPQAKGMGFSRGTLADIREKQREAVMRGWNRVRAA